MLENERIIVQDRGGIDAGIAALMQNRPIDAGHQW